MQPQTKSPFDSQHRQLGAKMTVFAGWELPLVYSSVQAEHMAVRRAAGLFDISHMGKLMLHGPTAESLLDHLLTNRVLGMPVGRARYGFFCNTHGGVVDDVIVYRLSAEQFFVVCNAARVGTDLAWLEQWKNRIHRYSNVEIRDLTYSWAGLALQGPQSRAWISSLANVLPSQLAGALTQLPRHSVIPWPEQDPALITATTGYTGEDGYEFFGAPALLRKIWEVLVRPAQSNSVTPAGLGARDSLRLEACLPLYGHELDEQTSPLEAGFERFVQLDGHEFIGADVLRYQMCSGPSRKLVAFKMLQPGALPRAGAHLRTNTVAEPGRVTSGGFSPVLGVGIGLGYVPAVAATPGTTLQIEARGRYWSAVVVQKPFVTPTRLT